MAALHNLRIMPSDDVNSSSDDSSLGEAGGGNDQGQGDAQHGAGGVSVVQNVDQLMGDPFNAGAREDELPGASHGAGNFSGSGGKVGSKSTPSSQGGRAATKATAAADTAKRAFA